VQSRSHTGEKVDPRLGGAYYRRTMRADWMSILPLLFAVVPLRADEPKAFRQTAHLQIGRASAAVIAQGDSLVMIGGESLEGPLVSAERWSQAIDDASRAWSYAGRMAVPRSGHTATLLQDGRVLVAGGGGTHRLARMAEILGDDNADPVQQFAFAGRMTASRSDHTATLLKNGRVLVAGGFDSGGRALATAELWDPATRKWTEVGRLHDARGAHAAALLPDGRVLVIGGDHRSRPSAREPLTSAELRTAEIFDPAGRTWTQTDPLPSGEERAYPTATALVDGRVLVAGGVESGALVKMHAWLWDSATSHWSSAGIGGGRASAMAVRLRDGRVLIVGGRAACIPTIRSLCAAPMETVGTSALWDPVSSAWSAGPAAIMPRSDCSTAALANGEVVVAGGRGSAPGELEFLTSAEVWTPRLK
jgi:hypothetical protein